jgi:hypothetical protein
MCDRQFEYSVIYGHHVLGGFAENVVQSKQICYIQPLNVTYQQNLQVHGVFGQLIIHAARHTLKRWQFFTMEQHALKNVNNCLNTNIYSYLETSVGQLH